MAFIGGQDLASLLTRENVIMGDDNINSYYPHRIKQAAYELSLGDEVYLTDNEKKVSLKLDDVNDTVNINPGQFALLLTEENIHMPNDKLGFISIKASEKLKGLINVSGFHVDPGFKGKLLFSVYNASPSVIQLRRREQYFLIWFCELKNSLDKNYLYKSKNHQGQSKIDLKYITPLINGDIASPNELLKKINENTTEIGNVRTSKDLKYEKVFWILTTILGLVTAANIVYWNRNSEYFRGYKVGVELNEMENLKNKKTLYVNDSLLLHRIDSLINKRLEKK